MKNPGIGTALVGFALLLAVCGGTEETEPVPSGEAVEPVEVESLDAGTLERYLAAAKAVRAAGLAVDTSFADDAAVVRGQVSRMKEMTQFSDEVAKEGFTYAEWLGVHVRVMHVLGAVVVGEETAKRLAELDAKKDEFPEEQFEALRAGIAASGSEFEDVTEEEKALVREHREAIVGVWK
jgi:hypothetical protein